MRTITVELGEQKYQIRQLPRRASREWRERFAQPVERLVGAVEYTGELLSSSEFEQQDLGMVIRQVGGSLMGGLSQTLLGSMDEIAEMLYAYSPELAADRERIEDCAYDDEVLAAFLEVLKMAYPFSEILTLVRGRPKTQTKKN